MIGKRKALDGSVVIIEPQLVMTCETEMPALSTSRLVSSSPSSSKVDECTCEAQLKKHLGGYKNGDSVMNANMR